MIYPHLFGLKWCVMVPSFKSFFIFSFKTVQTMKKPINSWKKSLKIHENQSFSDCSFYFTNFTGTRLAPNYAQINYLQNASLYFLLKLCKYWEKNFIFRKKFKFSKIPSVFYYIFFSSWFTGIWRALFAAKFNNLQNAARFRRNKKCKVILKVN